jgi:hypothetical protein
MALFIDDFFMIQNRLRLVIRKMHCCNVYYVWRAFTKHDLNLLHALHALLEERHVTRAAKRSFLSQPAMSRALDRMRETFGDPLFFAQVGFMSGRRGENACCETLKISYLELLQ